MENVGRQNKPSLRTNNAFWAYLSRSLRAEELVHGLFRSPSPRELAFHVIKSLHNCPFVPKFRLELSPEPYLLTP